MVKQSSPSARMGESESLYAGRVFSVERHRVREPDGQHTVRDIIHHRGSAVILPVLADGSIVLIRQFRIAVGCELWELPAGSREPDETLLQTARRELTEETGYRAARWKKLVEYYPSPGFLDERMAIFLADKLIAGVAAPEDDERITVHSFTLERAFQMMRRGLICDSKTLIGLLYWHQFRAPKSSAKKGAVKSSAGKAARKAKVKR